MAIVQSRRAAYSRIARFCMAATASWSPGQVLADRHLDDWRAAGIARFRLEFAHESGAETAAVAGLFADALAGKITAQELGRRLRSAAPQGVTEGSLYVPAGFRELPILQ